MFGIVAIDLSTYSDVRISKMKSSGWGWYMGKLHRAAGEIKGL